MKIVAVIVSIVFASVFAMANQPAATTTEKAPVQKHDTMKQDTTTKTAAKEEKAEKTEKKHKKVKKSKKSEKKSEEMAAPVAPETK